MTTKYTATEEARNAILDMVPMPLNGIAKASVVANLPAWLCSEESTHLCGQVVFIDGGSDAVIRGDSTWEVVATGEGPQARHLTGPRPTNSVVGREPPGHTTAWLHV